MASLLFATLFRVILALLITALMNLQDALCCSKPGLNPESPPPSAQSDEASAFQGINGNLKYSHAPGTERGLYLEVHGTY